MVTPSTATEHFMERRKQIVPMISAILLKTLELAASFAPKASATAKQAASPSVRPLICCFAIAVGLLSTPANAEGEIDITEDDGLFSVSIDQAALSRVVERLSELTEIPMTIAEDQDIKVSLSVEDYPLELLIEELSSSSMIVRRSINGEDLISEVVFMVGADGSGVPAAALPSGEPNAGIVAGGAETETQEGAIQQANPEANNANAVVTPSENAPATTQQEPASQ